MASFSFVFPLVRQPDRSHPVVRSTARSSMARSLSALPAHAGPVTAIGIVKSYAPQTPRVGPRQRAAARGTAGGPAAAPAPKPPLLVRRHSARRSRKLAPTVLNRRPLDHVR